MRNPQDGKDLHPTESELGLSLANRVHIIHGEHVVDVIPVLGSLSAKGGPWGAEMQWKFPPMWESRLRGHIYTPRGQFWRDFWQTKRTECMNNMFLMFYQVLGSLGAKGATWGAEMQGNWLGKPPKNR